MSLSSKKGLLVTPPYIGGDREFHPINERNFLSPIPKNQTSPPRPYLIIGFDTEYQSTDKKVKGKIYCDNEVLSYQYSCSLVAHYNNGSEIEWSGIVLPDSNKLSDRLTFKDFIEFSIGHGLSLYPKILIPRDIYFVSHFTRCDIPGFKDFKDGRSRKSLNFQNIRGSFVNVTQDLPVTLTDTFTGKNIKVSIKVRDTLHISPQQGGSLEKLGDVLQFEKIKLGNSSTEEKHIKTHMKDFLNSNWSKFREYGIRDSDICVSWVKKLIRLNYDVHDRQGKFFKLPITLSSIGVSLLEKHWYDTGIDRLDVIGKEKLVKKWWDRKNGRMRYYPKEQYIQSLYYQQDFLTDCYHGGRNEQFWFGQSPEGLWYDYDLSGCYPTAMSLIGKPDWDTIRPVKDTEEMLSFKPVDLTFCRVKFEFPKSVRFPTLPVRTEEGIIFPRTGDSTTHISEILLSNSLGCKLDFVQGITIDSERFGDSNNRVFRDFLKICVDNRNKYDKGTVENLFWKEISNSLYGKTGQGLRERRIYDLKSDKVKRLGESKITNPCFASFVTSFARGTLGEIMNNLPSDVNIFSVTTDGFLTDSTPQQMENSVHGVLGRYFEDSRYKLTVKDSIKWSKSNVGIYETKHLVRQLLGWRTRGQSTLKSSIDSDWVDYKPKDDEKVVLAKSGIKLPNVFGKLVENDEIIKLFFNRKPTDVVPMTLGLGIKDLYKGGYDFVHKEMKKRLSMEFDWKRKPFYVGESHVKYGDTVDCDHLFFSTIPWESEEDFRNIRSLWVDYNKTDKKCLKTKEDYRKFKVFVESKLSLTTSNSKYLSKKDGDIKRLRRDLIVSHKHRQSGTTVNFPHQPPLPFTKYIFKDKRLSSKELTYLLNDIGLIPCTKMDVDNGRKIKSFVRHTTPNTEVTRDVLQRVKKYIFPDLVIDNFLPKESQLNLESVNLKDCKLSQKMY